MNLSKTIITLALAGVVTIIACKKDSDDTTGTKGNTQVIPVQTIAQGTITLKGSSSIVVLAGAAISNTGSTVITGDLALSPGSSVGGFPPGILNGVQHINDAAANQAKVDLVAAYEEAKNRASSQIVTLSGNLGGLTLTPGLYMSTSSLAISSGDLTFDAGGNPNAVFVIQMASSFTTTSGRKIILSGGALASNIFWQVGSSATFGTTSVLKGTFLVKQSITFNTGATLQGRAMANIGSVNLAGNTITQ